MQAPARVYTIGHSTHHLGHFLRMLKTHGIAQVVDVRSTPFSKYTPQYNRTELHETLKGQGVRYVYMGNDLGGRPKADAFYDSRGHVLYGKLASTDGFRESIKWLVSEASARKTVVMCSEEDPEGCHRHLLISKVLLEMGVPVFHIRGDGSLEEVQDVRTGTSSPGNPQFSLFQQPEPSGEWKSRKPVRKEG